MNFMNRITRTLLIAVGVALLPQAAARAQEPSLTGLQEQVEKVNAGQEALRKEIQAMQRQLQEIRPPQPISSRTLLRPSPPSDV